MGKYSEILKEYIEQSNLSLSQIEKELRKKGFNKNKSYLSNLQNGKTDPPSPEVSIALAEIIGGDSVRLILTPLIESFRQNETMDQESFFNVVSNLIFGLISTMVDIYKEEFYEYIKHFDDSIDENFLQFLSYERMRNIYNEIPQEEIIKMFLPIDVEKKQINNESVQLTLTVSNDEELYLYECLKVYRKLQLSPKY
ncbi:helix-turn-helix transcriptional regulator [Fredinandcohnia onubensis]|uniref:helix-turn-helix transcriptional regulator n=1 Tax=Fredinandcohnia onubensis TaxID=1571209 RepID=UPI0015D4E300|nr:helix-turn-helix transcriptional regulator [Fredinandcohnia onubensis]